MSLLTKLLIPKVCPTFKYKHLTEQCGFKDAYTLNKNKPSLINHLFLMYEADKFTSDVDIAIRASDNLYSEECIRIDNKYYYVYTFTIPSTCRNLLRGSFSYKYEDCINELKFYNLQDEEVNKYVLGITHVLEKVRDELPEQDYVKSFPDMCNIA